MGNLPGSIFYFFSYIVTYAVSVTNPNPNPIGPYATPPGASHIHVTMHENKIGIRVVRYVPVGI